MILIFSNYLDETTNVVTDWLSHYHADFYRINGEELTRLNLAIQLDTHSDGIRIELHTGTRTISNQSCRAVWFRRWAAPSLLTTHCATDSLDYQANRYLHSEHNALAGAFYKGFSSCQWLNKPGDLSLNKLFVLEQAAQAGLRIPVTFICTSKQQAEAFLERNAKVITKSIGDTTFFYDKQKVYGNYTVTVSHEDLAEADRQTDTNRLFFPSLLQEQIEKKFEIRTFYLEGEFYSMAIFSQQDEQTQVDFRNYIPHKPNRTVPYLLPKETEEKLGQLMHSLGLNSGSIDMIKAEDGSYVFLEVNPIGQLAMVSYPCNYHLERKIAETLLSMQKQNGN